MADEMQQPQGPAPEAPKQEAPKVEVSTKTVMGVLSYIGPLVIVSYLTSKDDPFVKFHIKQGLVLFAIEVALWIIQLTFWQLWVITSAIRLGAVVLSIVGIVNVVQGKEKEIPLVGQFAKHFNI